jgi:putative Holliday junction resolvase
MIILGVDFGEARTGLAICDRSELLASPVGTVSEKNFDVCVEKVAAVAAERHAERIVVGYPKNMNGTIGERAERCQHFADCLQKKSGCETILWDERSTTVSAYNYLNQTNTRGKKRKAVVDTVAATIILESYLAYRKNQQPSITSET